MRDSYNIGRAIGWFFARVIGGIFRLLFAIMRGLFNLIVRGIGALVGTIRGTRGGGQASGSSDGDAFDSSSLGNDSFDDNFKNF